MQKVSRNAAKRVAKAADLGQVVIWTQRAKIQTEHTYGEIPGGGRDDIWRSAPRLLLSSRWASSSSGSRRPRWPRCAAGWISWRGLGLIVEAMERRDWDVSLTWYAEGWRASFLHPDDVYRPLDRPGSQLPFDTVGGGAARGLEGA